MILGKIYIDQLRFAEAEAELVSIKPESKSRQRNLSISS